MIQDQLSARIHIHQGRTIVLITHDQTIVPIIHDQTIVPNHEITFHKNIKQRSVMAQNYHVKLKTTINEPHGDAKMVNRYQAMPDYLVVIW